MGAAEALRIMFVAALVAVALAIVCAEMLHGRDDRRYAEHVRKALVVAEVRATQFRVDRERTRALADFAFEAAEQQMQADRSRMPSRDQVLAAAGDGAHDWLGVSAADRALEVALLEAVFRHEARPPVAADTDPDATAAW